MPRTRARDRSADHQGISRPERRISSTSAPMWAEVLRSRTCRPRARSRCATRSPRMAGVANTGSDRNWCGSDFDQANWYAFGRLAWDPAACPPSRSPSEWARMTCSNDPRVVTPVVTMMMGSRQAVGGLHDPARPRAPDGDASITTARARGSATNRRRVEPDLLPPRRRAAASASTAPPRGSNAVAQYAPQVAALLRRPAVRPTKTTCCGSTTCPGPTARHSGRPLWDELVDRYDRGVPRWIR